MGRELFKRRYIHLIILWNKGTKTASDKLRKIRKMTGYTQNKFADVYEIPVRTIKSWEMGERIPPKYVLNLLEFKVRCDFKNK